MPQPFIPSHGDALRMGGEQMAARIQGLTSRLERALPVRAIPRVRHTGFLRWLWWTQRGQTGSMLDLPQVARFGWIARRRAKAAADRRNLTAAAVRSGLINRRDDGLVP